MKSNLKDLLGRGVVEVIEKSHLEEALFGNPSAGLKARKLRVKFGIDPTSPDLHLGHTVPLRKLRQFQDAGHKAVLIIGDFTAKIGDPSGRDKTRPQLKDADVKKNLKTYLEQAKKVIDIKKLEIHHNSEWFKKNPDLILELMSKMSMERVLEREDFQKRIKDGQEVTILEALYPLLQGYDSVAVKADLEIGGSDQKFNLLMGRRMQRKFNMPEQDVLTMPLLEGTDGVRKMSKSYGNYIGLAEKPEIMFGKIMSIPDNLISKYTELLTDMPLEDLNNSVKIDPRGAKIELAENIVTIYHGKSVAEKAKQEFIRVVSNKEIPRNIPSFKIKSSNLNIIDLLVEIKLSASKSEARRLVEQGGVKFNGKKQTDASEIIGLKNGDVIQVGKIKFIKIVV
ncbi:MAG: tyrosyl-tRNA synthetase [Parcubacteria group bacterium Athens0714_26]|nr:MAG: tyrosyl-tRNA synthetase [Parcubacteria group bacterium Athens1014_26]TSD03689.1 MAG: tyrosyl-tRNA synthetase [Parcubacteria group bacterium Athens0714_26]